jgi:hypothetical protein
MPDPQPDQAEQAVAQQHTSPPPSAVQPCPLKRAWIEISLVDVEGNPVPNKRYRVVAPGGQVITGNLDANGFAHIDGIQEGTCAICFTEYDEEAWDWV